MKVFVVEVSPTVSDDGSTATYLFGTDAWATKPTDTPANTVVRPLLKNAGTVRRELFSGARVTGAITPSYGNIVLANPAPEDGAEGELDDWLGYGISGSRVVVRWGEIGAAYPAAWTTVYIAYAHSMVADVDSITIRLRDRLQLLDQPVVVDAFAGTGGIEGNGGVSRKKQIVLGDGPFFEPILIDANRQIYFVTSSSTGGLHDSWKASDAQRAEPANTYDVFDQGVKISRSETNYATSAEMLSSTPAAGYVKYWFGPDSIHAGPTWKTGPIYFRLGSPPAGQVRVNGSGYPTDDDHARRGSVLGSFFAGTLAMRAGINSADIEQDSLAGFNCLVNDDRTYLDALADLALSANGWFGFTRLDKFRSGYLLDPESENFYYNCPATSQAARPTTSLHVFDGQQVKSLRREPVAGMDVPIWKASFAVGETFPSEVANGAAPELRDYLTRSPAWTSFQGVSTATLLSDPGAGTAQVDIKGNFVPNQFSALLMAQRYLALYGGRRDFWTFTVPLSDDVLALELHAVVTLQSPRFGLAAGRKHRIVGITIDCAARVPQVKFVLWGGQTGLWTSSTGGPGTPGYLPPGGGGGVPGITTSLRNTIGDFTGWMYGTVDTVSSTGGDSGGAIAGSIGDFTGFMRGGVPPEDLAGAVWDSSNQTGTWTLSNSDKTATVSSGTSIRSVLGVGSASSGKRYLEFVFVSGGSFGTAVKHDMGISRERPVASGNSGAQLGAGYRRGGAVYVEGTDVGSVTALTGGDVVGLAVDFATGKVWLSRNGTWTQGDPGAGTGQEGTISGGTYYPFASAESAVAMVVDLRTTQSAFSYAPPSGFVSWATF